MIRDTIETWSRRPGLVDARRWLRSWTWSCGANAANRMSNEFLLALRQKGESVDELAGAATALRRHMTPIRSRHTRADRHLRDRRGWIGDLQHQHGRGAGDRRCRRAGGQTRQSQNLEQVRIGGRAGGPGGQYRCRPGHGRTMPGSTGHLLLLRPLAASLHETRVGSAADKLATPTIFNLLGPLCNPASAPFQLLGVGRPALRERMAAALRLLGTRRSAVVCGSDGLDEVTLNGPTDVTLVEQLETHAMRWTPGRFRAVRRPRSNRSWSTGRPPAPPSFWRCSAERPALPATSW